MVHSDFGPLEKRQEEFKWYLSQAENQYQLNMKLASRLCEEIQEDRRKPNAMTFKDIRSDGTIIDQNLSLVEGVNLILIRSHNIDEMNNSMWTKNNTYIQTMYSKYRNQFRIGPDHKAACSD
jgi:hypothetical protein